MYFIWKNISIRCVTNATTLATQRQIEMKWKFERRNLTSTTIPGCYTSHPLFIGDDEDQIVRNLIGSSLDDWRQKAHESSSEHVNKLNPSRNRNWDYAKKDEEKHIKSNPGEMDSCLKKQMINLEGALSEIQRRIEILKNNNAASSMKTNDLLSHLETWFHASLEAGHIHKQFVHLLQNRCIDHDSELALRLEDIAEPLESSLDVLIHHNNELDFDDFRTLVLSLGCWTQLHNSPNRVKNRIENTLSNLLISVETGSFNRIFRLRLPPNSPIFLQNVSDKLDLAHVWVFALNGTDGEDDKTLKKVRGNSFPAAFLGRSTNRQMGKDGLKIERQNISI
jgi:hypothetical protein